MNIIGKKNINCIKEMEIGSCKNNGLINIERIPIVLEHVLMVYVNEIFYFRLICTPIDLTELIIGRLYVEGLIHSIDEINVIEYNEENTKVNVLLNKKRSNNQVALRVENEIEPFCWKTEWLYKFVELFQQDTPLHLRTHATHSCFLARDGDVLYIGEDIGRHNTLDKAIGRALLNKIPLNQCMVYISGRIPVDMINKLICSKIRLIASNTVPTVQAIELAKKNDIILIGMVRTGRFFIYTKP